MIQSRDAQVAWQRLTREPHEPGGLTADSGQDGELLRHRFRSERATPVSSYCEFDWHGVANDVLPGDSGPSTVEHRSDVLDAPPETRRGRARENLVGQFRELVLKCAVRDVELALDRSYG